MDGDGISNDEDTDANGNGIADDSSDENDNDLDDDGIPNNLDASPTGEVGADALATAEDYIPNYYQHQ